MKTDEQSVLLDVYQRLGGIEAKIDDIKSIRITAENAKIIAQRAEHKADNNMQGIEKIREKMFETRKEAIANRRWLIGTVLTTALSLAGLLISLF